MPGGEEEEAGKAIVIRNNCINRLMETGEWEWEWKLVWE